MPGIYGFTKTINGIVVPLNEEEANQLETMMNKPRADLNPELKMIKKEEYVSVVSGEHAGKYGIVMGSKSGKNFHNNTINSGGNIYIYI